MATRPAPVLDKSSRQPAVLAFSVPLRAAGFAVLIAIGLALLALVTWSINDPSFSFATSARPGNWLGYPGALFADLAFQLFGLAILPVLAPPALWGWHMIGRRLPARMGLRALALGGALLLTTGVLAFVAVPSSWPLPTGLGGLTGAGFAALAQWITGATPGGITALIIAIFLLAPTAALFWLATAGKPAAPVARPAPEPDTGTGTGNDHTRPFDVVLGALAHFGLSLRTTWRRFRTPARQRAAQDADQAWRDNAMEPPLDAARPHGERQEPALFADGRTPDYVDVAPAGPAPGGDLLARQSIEQAAPRIARPAQPPRQGTRLAREAQGSLLDDKGFELPELGLLAEPHHLGPSSEHAPERLENNARRLEGVLEDFGVRGDIINVRPGPVVTLYELEPAPGIKSSRVISLADDIARSMSAISARVAVVPGRNAIGIELPNDKRETVYLREMLASADFEKVKSKLPVCLGKTIGGDPIIADLARMPHLLIAGTTGSGKSVAINTMILSLLYRMAPEQCRLIMIDPKMLELSVYDGIPHLLTPVVTDPSKAVVALKWAVREMEDRYRKMSRIGVRNIEGFNQRVREAQKKGKTITRTVQTGFDKGTGEALFESEDFDLEPLPFIVVIVDEMADLMMVAGKDIEGAIQRLAQMARAAGIHLIMATQRPSVDVITGTIKANFPTRVSFQVTSKIDSRTILGEQGAEQLLGMGDMLYMAGGGRTRRLHGPFVSDGEVEQVVAHLKSQGAPDYLEAIIDDEEIDGPGDTFSGSGDELYDKAVNIVLNDQKASTSYIQRRLSIGYNRAATLIERMENEGVISPANHAGKREILTGDGAAGY